MNFKAKIVIEDKFSNNNKFNNNYKNHLNKKI